MLSQLGIPPVVVALTPEQKKVFDSGVPYFDVEIDSCQNSGTALVGAENAEKIWNYLIGKGLTPIAAAGIMGNLQAESGFEPRRVQYGMVNTRGEISKQGQPSSLDDNVPVNGVSGYGLTQWTSINRQKALADAAEKAGLPAGDLGVQLEYLKYESTEGARAGAWNEVNKQSNAGDATLNWHKTFTGSNDTAQKLQGRIGFATAILTQFGSGVSVAPSTDSSAVSAECPSEAGNGVVAGNIVQTALNLAWPEPGHGLTPKPEYAAAIQQVNPSAPYRGADCGSFVGAVMIASGADPSYPKQQSMTQQNYVLAHPEKYDIARNVRVSDLLPGDILIANIGNGQDSNGHTFIFVGSQAPKNYDSASASGNKRMPNLGNTPQKGGIVADRLGNYIRARLK